jgi:hypothetical protein
MHPGAEPYDNRINDVSRGDRGHIGPQKQEVGVRRFKKGESNAYRQRLRTGAPVRLAQNELALSFFDFGDVLRRAETRLTV